MRRRFHLSVLALICVFAFSVPQAIARELPKPNYIALYFYADWCAGCQILSPKLQEVRKDNNLDRQDIVFVKLDLTDKARIHQSILLAQALGVGDFLKQQGSATGYVAVLDIHTQEETLRFNASETLEDMAAKLSALQGQS